ncbi:sulfite oxidase [Trifolium repens]|nr:sulfite oxidase [Trifolium repens]
MEPNFIDLARWLFVALWQCVICSLEDVSTIKPGRVKISGYAASGCGRGIERVDVYVDGCKTLMEATRSQKQVVWLLGDKLCRGAI